MDNKKKNDLKRYSITLYDEDYKNFEKLKDELTPNSLSGMIRYLFGISVNNIQFFKKATLPDKSDNSSIDDNIQILKQMSLDQDKNLENEIISIKNNQDEMANQLKKIMLLFESLDKEKFDQIQSNTNGLGGKME